MITLTREVMQMALDAFEAHAKQYPHMVKGYTVDAAQALRAALAQPEPEPVAWMHNFIDYVITKNRPTDITRNAGRWTPLYTAPPQREWAGLTDKERAEVWNKCDPYDDVDDFALAIEAKLKEKNG